MRALFVVLAILIAVHAAGCEVAFPVSDSVSAGFPSPCSEHHRFCADFDEGPLPQHPELVPYSAGGGVLQVDTADARSLPGSLVASAGTLRAGDPPAFAFIGPNVDGSFTDMHVGFYLKIDVHGSGGNDVAAIGIAQDDGTIYVVQIVTTGDGRWSIAEYRPTGSPTSIFHASAGQVGDAWMKVRADIHLDGDQSYAVLTVDDQILFAHESIAPTLSMGKPFMSLGITSLYGDTSPWSVRIDNVTFDP